MEKTIILISFKYPPYPGVGAFRWANLSYQLAEKNYIVHVITTKWEEKENSSFLNEIKHKNIKIHKLPSLGFHNFRYNNYNNRYLRKIKKIFLKTIKPFYFLDDAQQWHWVMIPYVKKLIKREMIKTLIATGAPFSVNFAAARIKNSCPFVKLIQDFRDPWNDDKLYIKNFSKPQKRKSENFENYSLNQADKIVSVTKMLSEMFVSRGGKKVTTIYNGYNSKKQEDVKNAKLKNNNIKFIYAGNLNCGRENCLDYLLDNISKKSNIIVDIYCSNKDRIINKYHKYIEKKILNIKSRVSYEELVKIIPDYDYGLHFNAKEYPDALSTKIYDYLSVQVPVLSVNYGGEIEQFLDNFKFGYSINIDKNNFNEIIKKIERNEYLINQQNVMKFDYQNIADNYIQIINGK